MASKDARLDTARKINKLRKKRNLPKHAVKLALNHRRK